MFRAEPGVAWASAIELENPLAQIIHPEYAPATSHPKSIRMRLAISRASNPATTKPQPQFTNEVIMTGTMVKTIARLGVVASPASRLSPPRTGRELERA